MAELRCVIERITYQNTDSGYTIMKAKANESSSLVTIVGNLLDVPVGSELLCNGNWKVDPRYGRQFSVQSWEEVMPSTLEGIERYLGSGLIRGIGPAYAKAIVEHFGLETIEVIENNIERLSEIPRLGERRIEQIRESWEKQREIKNVMLFLQSNGVSTTFAAKIYRHYGKNSVTVVRNNPYRLADDIWGVGFKTADTIASKLGYEKNDIRRCKSGVIYTLNELTDDGHVYAEKEQLMKSAIKLLGADEAAIQSAISEMVHEKDLMIEGDAIYLPLYYTAEVGTATKLLELIDNTNGNIAQAECNIESISRQTGVQYDDIQIDAINKAIKSKVMVLTGGPGTGKTTTTQGIIAAMEGMGLKVLLAAPTGRAAKRMSEATGMDAKTIHRLLEFHPLDGYRRNPDNPLDGDVLIVDECSMIDIILMYNLMKAIPAKMRFIMVGDIDQLPSVGAGNVLRDIIESDRIPVIRLTRIFRQAQTSQIVMGAHSINQGQFPDIRNRRNTDFKFIAETDKDAVASKIVSLVKKRYQQHMAIQRVIFRYSLLCSEVK
jgi:exodeoxyribonuclease V alpha subunit